MLLIFSPVLLKSVALHFDEVCCAGNGLGVGIGYRKKLLFIVQHLKLKVQRARSLRCYSLQLDSTRVAVKSVKAEAES